MPQLYSTKLLSGNPPTKSDLLHYLFYYYFSDGLDTLH